MIYQWLSDKIPKAKYIKKRNDSAFVIVCSAYMDICYLNSMAGYILDLCDGKNTIQDIVNVIVKEYQVEMPELQKDIVEIIRDLQWKKIIFLEA